MRVHESYHAQSSHDQLAKLVDREIQCWKGRKILELPANIVGIGFYAVSTRVLAAFYGTMWAANEAVCFVPRMASLGLSIAVSEPLSTATIFRIMSLCTVSLRTTVLQGASFAAAVTFPEYFYGQALGQKTFFLHHIEAFVETLPDLPEVYKPIYERTGFNLFDSLSQIWLDLGFTNEEWKEGLKLEFCKRAKDNPGSLHELLDPTSNQFTKCIFSALLSRIGPKLNELVFQNSLSEQDIKSLDCKALAWLYTGLSNEARQKIFSMRADLESGLENDIDHSGTLFELVTDYRFRAPKTVELASLLLQKMKEARDELLAKKTYTPLQIAEAVDAPLCAICDLGIFKLVAEARLSSDNPPHLIFRGLDGRDIHLTDNNQFFKTKDQLLELHRAIHGGEATDVFQRIVTLRLIYQSTLMNKEKLREEDQTPWEEAFAVDLIDE